MHTLALLTAFLIGIPPASLNVAAHAASQPGRSATSGSTDAVRATQQEPQQALQQRPMNVLLIMSDDLTATALSCYGNTVCQTPHIDALAARGTRFTRAYCQATYCGPSRASMLTGYYPHATGVLGYTNPRPNIGDRATWPQHFQQNGYYTARVSKIFHMGVPGGIEVGGDGRDHNEYNGADDHLSWTERFNSPGPEWKAKGRGQTLEGNPDRSKPVVGGNTFVVVEAEGDDLVHSDGMTTRTAIQLIQDHQHEPFWLGVGFVRPHVPFVAPAKYFDPFRPFDSVVLPARLPGDWDDIPAAGINYKTSVNMRMDEEQQKLAVASYLACVRFIDAQVGQIMDALAASGQQDRTIVIFTSDHGYHLGEHDFWAKVSLHEESAAVPLIMCVPGQAPAVCDSLVELIDLFPTTASLCSLPVPERLQGRNVAAMLEDAEQTVRGAAFSVAPSRQGFLLRTERHAFIQYGENAEGGIELFDMVQDPRQFHNLASAPEFQDLVTDFRQQMTLKLADVRDNDLPGR